MPRQELLVLFVFIFYLFFVFLGLHLKHMEVPRLGIQSELQLPVYATATAMQDPSHVWDTPQLMATLDLNPLIEAMDRTHVLVDTSQVR